VRRKRGRVPRDVQVIPEGDGGQVYDVDDVLEGDDGGVLHGRRRRKKVTAVIEID
jgi:hypothetical protein